MHMSYEKTHDFRLISSFISETIQDRAIIIMKCKCELVHDLANGAIFDIL